MSTNINAIMATVIHLLLKPNDHCSQEDKIVKYLELDCKAQPLQSEIANYEKVLDLGCGKRQLKGDNVITVDIDIRCRPKVVCNLSQFPYPFKDDVFDFIHCSQVIEHISNTVNAIGEILRIAKPGCKVFIGVPHFSSAIAYKDPTHKSFFSVKTIDYFCSNYFSFDHSKCFEIISAKIIFSKLWRFIALSSLFNSLQTSWENRLSGIFPAKFIEWHLVVRELPDGYSSE